MRKLVTAPMHSEPVISTLINVSSTDRQDEQRLKIPHTRNRHDCAPQYIYMVCMCKGEI